MTTAGLGLGTYRIRCSELNDIVTHTATETETGWIDTAPNYLNGQAQLLLAPALAQHRLPLSTKVGFLTDQTAREAVSDGVLSVDDAERGHCLSTPYVQWQCDRNRTELGRERLDLVFAHNPERTADDPHEALLAAFTALEAEATAGALSAYGVATWDGFDTGRLSIPVLHELAAAAAGTEQHHLRAIQLPVSLVSATAFSQALDSKGPIAQAADLGWQVFASAPLFGGKLPHLATHELTALLNPELTIAQACLLAAASCPGVTRVLISTSARAHWTEAQVALQKSAVPIATLRKVLDVLAAD